MRRQVSSRCSLSARGGSHPVASSAAHERNGDWRLTARCDIPTVECHFGSASDSEAVSRLREAAMNDSVRGTLAYSWRIDVRKLLVGFAGLAIAACQSNVMEAVPETPNDRAVTELLALLGSTYDENSDDRLRSALGLPSDFPIGTIMYATVDGGSSGVSADFLPPECSIRDGATREEAEEFTRCHECPVAIAVKGCSVRSERRAPQRPAARTASNGEYVASGRRSAPRK